MNKTDRANLFLLHQIALKYKPLHDDRIKSIM